MPTCARVLDVDRARRRKHLRPTGARLLADTHLFAPPRVPPLPYPLQQPSSRQSLTRLLLPAGHCHLARHTPLLHYRSHLLRAELHAPHATMPAIGNLSNRRNHSEKPPGPTWAVTPLPSSSATTITRTAACACPLQPHRVELASSRPAPPRGLKQPTPSDTSPAMQSSRC
jgi:hypothetical protein